MSNEMSKLFLKQIKLGVIVKVKPQAAAVHINSASMSYWPTYKSNDIFKVVDNSKFYEYIILNKTDNELYKTNMHNLEIIGI